MLPGCQDQETFKHGPSSYWMIYRGHITWLILFPAPFTNVAKSKTMQWLSRAWQGKLYSHFFQFSTISKIFQPFPANLIHFQPLPAFVSNFQPFTAYSYLFQHITCSIFQSIPSSYWSWFSSYLEYLPIPRGRSAYVNIPNKEGTDTHASKQTHNNVINRPGVAGAVL